MREATLHRWMIWLSLLLILPLATYTMVQIMQRNTHKEMIASIYGQQLDGILFSVNQYAWDQFTGWSTELSGAGSGALQLSSPDRAAAAMLQKYPVLKGVFFHAADDSWNFMLSNPEIPASRISSIKELIANVERDSASQLLRLARRAQQGLIYPVRIRSNRGDEAGGIFFIVPRSHSATVENNPMATLSLWLDLDAFVQQLVTYKLLQAESSRFSFLIRDTDTGRILYRTATDSSAGYEKEAPLWILPQVSVSIKMQGMTLAAMADRQTTRNLLFLGLVNALILVTLFFLARTLVREYALSRIKTDFVANVSHELRTPLALIRMYAETLEMGRVRTNAKRQQYYRIIMNESNRLTQLINNILDFSKIESGKISFHLVPEDVSRMVEETLEMYRSHLEQKGFTVQSVVEPEIPAIMMDRQAMMRALINLLDNAMKFSKEEKMIGVRVLTKENTVRIEVEDFGIGIPEKEQQRIFEKFYRVESSLVHNTKGSGIGLALVAHILAAHGGRVEVQSRIGKGSTFSLVLPVVNVHNSERI